MVRKLFVIAFILLINFGIITNYIDSGRVTTGHEPKYVLKFISKDGNKVTYLGLGYKVIRYVGVSPKENFSMSRGVKMGHWFMNYKLDDEDIKVYFDDTVKDISNSKNVSFIVNILENLKYEDSEDLKVFKYNYKINYKGKNYYFIEYKHEICFDSFCGYLSDEDFKQFIEIINK